MPPQACSEEDFSPENRNAHQIAQTARVEGIRRFKSPCTFFAVVKLRIKNLQMRCPQVHRRDSLIDPRACGPCGQRLPLCMAVSTNMEQAALPGVPKIPCAFESPSEDRAPARLAG
jgi:hypothetical protein